MDWIPDISAGDGFIHQRIVRALEADIATGRLATGARLPPQRRLAHQLHVGVGAITQAYAEAEARGLIEAHVGRGSFVAAGKSARWQDAAVGGLIDLAHNTPPAITVSVHLASALTRLRRRGDLAAHLDYPPPAGLESHRRAGAVWLAMAACGLDADAGRIICTGGAQQALAAALGAICRPGDRVIVEAVSFSGIKTLAAHMNYALIPVDMDDQGISPEGLDRAAAAGARAAYVQPLQNPTGRVMGLARRQAIAGVARARDLMLVEDDLYGAYARGLGLPPLAALAPERVFYVNGLSKSLTPGLRVGYLLPPPTGDWADRCMLGLRAIAFGPPALAGLVAAQWIEDGSAAAMLAAHRDELTQRTRLALDLLTSAEQPAGACATHLWLPMTELDAERVAARALMAGVQVTPPATTHIPGGGTHGLRICLGAAPDRTVLALGLRTLAAALTAGAEKTLGMV